MMNAINPSRASDVTQDMVVRESSTDKDTCDLQ